MPSIKRAAKYVIGRVKQVFTPSSQKASYDLNSGTASAGTTTSAPTSSGTSVSSGISAGAGTTTTTSRTSGGGGGGSSGGQSITPTTREEALKMSLPSGERNLPPQSTTSSTSSSRVGSTTRNVVTRSEEHVRSRVTDYSQMSRQPTAKEEVLQMSIPDNSFRTKGSVKEDYFYQNLLAQRREFESRPESSPYGMSTPEGETYFFLPDVSKAQKYSQESFVNLPAQEKGWLNARSLIGGEQIRQYQFQSQFPRLEQDTKLFGTEFGLRQVIRSSERFNINPLSQTEFGRAMSRTKEDFLYGFIPKTKGEVAITAISFGVGGLIGGGLRTGGTLLRTFTPKAAPIIEKGISVGFGIATIPYVATQGSRVVFAKEGAGIAFGEVSREFTALSLGGYAGARSEGIIKGYVRTRKLDKLNIDITAPEFLEGQQFPGIKKGQTAEQLKSEFYEPILPSEKGYIVKLKGYTGEGEFVSLKQTKELPFKLPEISPRGFS
ncbi:hypothetical protein M1146_08250, partial [Patescibacteria group bacterium]|nr:hypothetical protein [Patescibacteria group bacterium]